MTARRSSVYSLRVASYQPAETLDDLTDALAAIEVPVLDSATTTEDGVRWAVVGFRVGGDGAAIDMCARLLKLAGIFGEWKIVTGYGIHRRTVASR